MKAAYVFAGRVGFYQHAETEQCVTTCVLPTAKYECLNAKQLLTHTKENLW